MGPHPPTLCPWCWLPVRQPGCPVHHLPAPPLQHPVWSGLVWSAPSPPGSWSAQENTGVSKYPRPRDTHGRHSSPLQPPACLGPPKRSSSTQQQRSEGCSKTQRSPARPSGLPVQLNLTSFRSFPSTTRLALDRSSFVTTIHSFQPSPLPAPRAARSKALVPLHTPHRETTSDSILGSTPRQACLCPCADLQHCQHGRPCAPSPSR